MTLFNDLLGQLAAPSSGRNRRISSNEQPNWNDGNFDMTRLAPGEVFEFPILNGPGMITHIWMTSHSGGMNELNAITLRIYWDGAAEPSVEAPLADFFAVGQGTPASVESVPVQVSPSGSLTCYWRMPFEKSARIVISNDNPDRSSGLYWQVDWVELPELPPGTPRFHARYRQEYPAVMGRDYLLADIEGAGQYVGTVLSVTLAQDGWFGEGDDFFYIDGEEVPSLQGTGTEDYFNDAWGFRPRTGAWFGQPRWQGWSAGDSGVCYRWHVLDPVHFTKSLKVTIEHKGNREDPEEAWYIERPDFYSSVAFWYQTGPARSFGGVPSWAERRVPWESHHLVRSWSGAVASGEEGPTVETAGFFGGRPSLRWQPVQPGERLELPFHVAQGGRCAVRLTAFTAPSGGRWEAVITGAHPSPVMELNLNSEEEGEVDLLLGTMELAPGDHTVAFTALGSASGSLQVEEIRWLRLPPEAVREHRGENEAHFVRLAIGRAVYAYRLAYNSLPSSLPALIASGILGDRYTVDENGAPLTSRLEDDRFMVESTAPGGWTHSWRGLDARR
ncbi:MAG: DUF2961 domain-containing protein [Armatimonadetes bacterium]|nr:DUF2961 domain-containing protein [Armatimonadota bacterium]MDE2207558.1 DUF2961 domain-containing protein [Armatimonadota bacterium]